MLDQFKQPLLAQIKQPLVIALAFSLAVHAFVLSIPMLLPKLNAIELPQQLQVVLVNSKSDTAPVHVEAMAQNNLDGGGNTEEERVAKSPLPTLNDDKQFTPEQTAQRVQQLEIEAKRLMMRSKSQYNAPQEKKRQPQEATDQANGEELVQRSMEIARLEAQIDKDMSAYQKMPRRKFIGARTSEYRYAQYIEAWRVKLEHIGTLNYPEIARQKKIYGSLQLTVSILADGSVERVEVNRSSGKRILDAAAQRIVKLASPFAPLPADIRKDIDILTITRTWTFTKFDKLEQSGE